jgi:hypothetical protein
MMYRRLAGLVLTASTLAFVGCGGSGKANSSTSTGSSDATVATTPSTSTTPAPVTAPGPPLSTAQLVAKAQTICRRLNVHLAGPKYVIRSQQDLVRIVPLRIAAEQSTLTELSKLTPPASSTTGYKQLLAARRTLIEDTTKLGEDAATGNPNTNSVYASSATVEREMAETAKSVGIVECGHIS